MRKTLKAISAITAAAMIALTGCGKSSSAPAPKNDTVAINDGGTPSGSKILIAYFAVAENSDVDAKALLILRWRFCRTEVLKLTA